MNLALTAIETAYCGHRFRSRLEARWAVFLDALGIKYDYEPEGFELPSGRYLPDFRLHGLTVDESPWLEVKPVEPTERESRLAFELAAATGSAAVIASGLPPGELIFWGPNFEYFPNCHLPQVWDACECHRPELRLPLSTRIRCMHDVPSLQTPPPTVTIAGAALLARSARFEYDDPALVWGHSL